MAQQPSILPAPLEANWNRHWQCFEERAPQGQIAWLTGYIAQSSLFENDLQRVWSCSEYVAARCASRPEMFRDLVESGDLTACYTEGRLGRALREQLSGVADDSELMRRLRLFRQREMVRIIWRSFTHQAALEETTRDMTWLAEAVIRQTLDATYPRACEDWGTPQNGDGEAQRLVVLGMGKLGAWELNVSSDIDLIFAYPDKGETFAGKRQLSNQEFFTRLGQKLIRLIDERTADGFVFRVDMRLRPYGHSGALALNFDAMEEYYQSQGRDWERYAMIKARVIAGDWQAGERLIALLRPFTYRKYVDYSAIQALRDMKALINREVKRTGLADDLKKGAGGIREVEFIAQAFQIIRGGRDSRFQQQPLNSILPLLEREKLLPEGVSSRLYEAYRLLRNLEHAIQGWDDQQTQQLPSDDAGRARLAWLMGFDGWDALAAELERQRAFIRQVFSDVVAEQEEQAAEENPDAAATAAAQLVWQGHSEDYVAIDAAAALGYRKPKQIIELLEKLRSRRAVLSLPVLSRAKLDDFMPLLLHACGQAEAPERALQRLLTLVEAVLRRSAYLVMLTENPRALERLVALSDASTWMADQLSRHPALLDELLDSRTLFSPPDKAELQDELRQQLLRVPDDGLEAQMDVLRYFRMSHGLRVAACEITGVLPLMQVSDYLTWLAEAILEQVLVIAWEQMVQRYGEPGSKGVSPGMVIIGYGKMGGIELGHGSDLDLVFLHNAATRLATTGENSVDNATFFTRLGQRIIHILTAQTASGTVYEVDMRLRPSGNSGLLVTSVESFARYQREDAWTWEHQALVRARPVAGDNALARQFDEIRREILAQPREVAALQQEVREMRQKMRDHLGSSAAEQEVFHLKQDSGGIADIEFLVQYHVLAFAKRHASLAVYTDNIRILEALEGSGLLSKASAECLQDAYIFFRSMGHRLDLQGETGSINPQEAGDYREQVIALWEQIFAEK